MIRVSEFVLPGHPDKFCDAVGDANIRDAQAQRGDENYLIVGTDSRAGNNSKLGGGDTTEIGPAPSAA